MPAKNKDKNDAAMSKVLALSNSCAMAMIAKRVMHIAIGDGCFVFCATYPGSEAMTLLLYARNADDSASSMLISSSSLIISMSFFSFFLLLDSDIASITDLETKATTMRAAACMKSMFDKSNVGIRFYLTLPVPGLHGLLGG